MKEYCNICQKETCRYKNGKCRSCAVRETWKNRTDVPFEKRKEKSWCCKCQKMTIHHKNGTCQGCAVRAQWKVRSHARSENSIKKLKETLEKKKLPKIKSICPICGKTFYACDASRHKTHNQQKYCSLECAYKAPHKVSEKTRQKMRNNVARLMKEGRWNRYTTGRGGKREDLGHYVRSNWEANVARIFKLQGREYEFEKHSFNLSDGRIYIPDFYLPKENLYVEVKGVMLEKLLSKYNLAKKEYPQENFKLISPEEYSKLREEYKDKILWEGV